MQNNQRDLSTRTRQAAGRTAPVIPDDKNDNNLPLGANNFILIGVSLLLIIVGFALTSGSPSGLDEFNPDIFSTRRIVVGPCICFIGFVLMAVAIAIKPKSKL